MDKPIQKKFWKPGRVVLIGCMLVFMAFLAYLFASRSGKPRLKVDPSRMTFSQVGRGDFREYYPFDSKVEPVTSVYLDIESGGRVDQIFVEGGKLVKKGDHILRISNPQFQRDSIETERNLLESLNTQRTTQYTTAKSKLTNEDTLLGVDHDIHALEQKHRRYEALAKDGLIPIQEFEAVRDDLSYTKNKRDLLKERIRQEELLNEKQMQQASLSIERLNMSRELLAKTVERLEVRAPISGYLSSIDAQVGQNIQAGKRIGQIDLLDKLKLSAGIDQYYLAKVTVGTKGKCTLADSVYRVEVQKIYPEVKDNKFTVDIGFAGETPAGIKRGQTVTIELDFSEPGKGLLVSKGGFYNQTNGQWVYLIAADRMSACRTNIRTGRQNPRDVEVLEGLREGDWIVTSGYDAFNGVDILEFPEPVNLK